jgi:hypothetical protein
MKHHSTKEHQSLFTDKRCSSYKWNRGVLRVFRLMLKLRGYKPCGVMDAGAGYILNLLDGPLHHRL